MSMEIVNVGTTVPTLIPILLQYSGEWVSESKFVNFLINGMIINSDCSYGYFVDEIYKQLGRDSITSVIEIKYTVKDGYVAISIYNDMSVRLYVEMKKKNWISLKIRYA